MVWLGDGELSAKTERADRAQRASAIASCSPASETMFRALLPAFDVFAMSSLYEGLPCAVVEAMTLRDSRSSRPP